MPPTFLFRHATAAQREQPQLFTDALLKSGRFYRDSASLLHFKVGPDDFVRVANKHAFRELLLSGEFVCLEGDTDAAAFDCLWQWVVSRMWVLPRLDPAAPLAKPAPVAGHRYVAPVLGRGR